MKQRGRRSAAALETAAIVTADHLDSPVLHTRRLAAPAHLTDAERAVWLEVVNDQPASAFMQTHAPLLELYCRHVVYARVIADELANFERAWLADDDGLKRFDRLLAMAEREGRAASSLATRLRITRQAVAHQETASNRLKEQQVERTATKERKPWQLPAGK